MKVYLTHFLLGCWFLVATSLFSFFVLANEESLITDELYLDEEDVSMDIYQYQEKVSRGQQQEDQIQQEEFRQQQIRLIEEEYQRYVKEVEDRYNAEIEYEQKLLEQMRKDLDKKLLEFGQSQEDRKNAYKGLVETDEKSDGLNKNIKGTEKEILKIEQKLKALEQKISQYEYDLQVLEKEKENLEREKRTQKVMILHFFRTFQVTDPEFIEEKELERAMEFLFTDTRVSEQIRDKKALEEIESRSRTLFESYSKASGSVYSTNKKIIEKNQKLILLRDAVLTERKILRDQKLIAKKELYFTEKDEKEYQRKWVNSLVQMENSANDIKSIKLRAEEVNQKLKELERKKKFEKDLISREDLKKQVIDGLHADMSDEDLAKMFSFSDDENAPFIWPVEPTLGISAYFQDGGYKKRFGIAHNAIDIPVIQGSPVKSVMPGYVYKAVDNGMGYSYIIVLHRDNLRTVYGHISEIMVEEGDLVQAGDVIGKSGGAPGTKGAGTLTTGAHLHFETLEGEEYKNPLLYLPKEDLY